ncbi:hypothetical protein GGR57DRAFT_510618 [Xylariaceae sp. FL1272]|nr:hypothetical protein GGR57DRAFT_510618 [Xylariaceae sp. FL1272]
MSTISPSREHGEGNPHLSNRPRSLSFFIPMREPVRRSVEQPKRRHTDGTNTDNSHAGSRLEGFIKRQSEWLSKLSEKVAAWSPLMHTSEKHKITPLSKNLSSNSGKGDTNNDSTLSPSKSTSAPNEQRPQGFTGRRELSPKHMDVIELLFHVPKAQVKGELSWVDFQSLMAELRFRITPLGGFIFEFEPTKDAFIPTDMIGGKIVIHGPHPEDKWNLQKARRVGRRLGDYYDWKWDNFELKR